MRQQLYMASNSPLIKTRRRRSHMLVPLAYVGFGIYAMATGDQVLATVLLFTIAVLWLLFYPKYSAWRYKRHFKSWINERHSELLGQEIEMNLKESAIELTMDGQASTIDWKEIKSLVVFESQLLFLLNSGSSIIIAQNSTYDTKKFVAQVSQKEIECIDASNWEWK